VPKGLFSLFGGRSGTALAEPGSEAVAVGNEPAYATKALGKFLKVLQTRENPAIIDLGPVVGSNVTFFGEQLGCRIRVEDLAVDIDRHVKNDTLEQLPNFFDARFAQDDESIDGVLCWDVFDFLDRPAAQALATVLSGLLKPDGCLLGFFSTAESHDSVFSKYVVVDESTLKYRTYPALRARQRKLLNGDIIKLFKDLRVTDSFLMKSKVREMLFRKPAVRT
jgi:hypothetical protein